MVITKHISMLTSARLVSSVFWTCHRQGQDVGSLGSLVVAVSRSGPWRLAWTWLQTQSRESEPSRPSSADLGVTLVRVVGELVSGWTRERSTLEPRGLAVVWLG
jgi:hypothetical protein